MTVFLILKIIRKWISSVRATGSAVPNKPVRRPKSVRTPENIAAVRASIEQFPDRSARKHAAALRISSRTVRRILHSDLHLHPHKMMFDRNWAHKTVKRRDACNAILTAVPPGSVMWTSNEAHFHLCGTVNKQTFRYWASENPRELHQRPLHNSKVTVWCTVSSIGIIGPYFFESGGLTVTVTSARYCEMLENFLRPKMEEYGEEHDTEAFWFQQDGATAHTARRSREILQELFPGRLISLRGDVTWPPRSPDLTPCDFFLWEYVKAEVYKVWPRTLEALKEAIEDVIVGIPQNMLRRVAENFFERLNMCIARQGRHLDDMIFKTSWKKRYYMYFWAMKTFFMYLEPIFNNSLLKSGIAFCPTLYIKAYNYTGWVLAAVPTFYHGRRHCRLQLLFADGS